MGYKLEFVKISEKEDHDDHVHEDDSGDESDNYEMALDTLDENDELYKTIMVALQEDAEEDYDNKEAGGGDDCERSDDTSKKGGERSDDTSKNGGERYDDTKETLVKEIDSHDNVHNGDKVPLLLEEASKESTRSSESSTDRSEETTESDRSSWEKLE